MGICQSETKKHKTTNSNNDPLSITKRTNPHSIIKGLKNQKITKHINEINGDMVSIDNCSNSQILVMDFSSHVIIENCENCIIFIAPCKSSINLRNSKNILIICASQQFRCTNIENTKISLFSNSKPAIETVRNISLSCFCFNYIKLDEMFTNAKLNIWENQWSEFQDFSKDSKNVSYFNVKDDLDFIEKYMNTFKEQETDIFQFYPVLYTAGLSYSFDEEYENLFLIFKESKVINYKNEINEICNNNQIILIRTRNMNYKDIYSTIENREIFKNSFWNNNDNYIIMWFVIIDIKLLNELKEYITPSFGDDTLIITKLEIKDIHIKIKKIFESFKI